LDVSGSETRVLDSNPALDREIDFDLNKDHPKNKQCDNCVFKTKFYWKSTVVFKNASKDIKNHLH
jgi:hypothetical protein